MLERTAGCLESGSLWRLLPRPEQPFKSRRMLQTAFWNHGASELDLSLFGIEVASERQPEDPNQTQRRQEAVSSSGLALDFLYPPSTLAVLGQYPTSWFLDRHDPRRLRLSLAKLGQRLYSSAATVKKLEPVDSSTNSIQNDLSKDNSSPALTNSDTYTTLRNLIELGSSTDYEEAWRLYELVDETERQLVEIDLVKYLATSKRRVDAERTVSLFNGLSPDKKVDDVFSATIRAYLVLKDIPTAIRLQEEALASPLIPKDHPAGSDFLVAHFLNVSSYTLAWEAWQRTVRNRKHGRYALWQAVDRMPNLQDCVLSLANFNEKYTERVVGTSVVQEKSLASFTAFALSRALVPKGEALDSTKHLAIWRFLRSLNADSAPLYEDIITKLLNLNHNKLATQCYRQFRERSDEKISRPTLHGVLRVFCKNYSIGGMQDVLDDFFRYYKGPTALCYKLVLNEFAAQGDVITVKHLFEQFSARFFKGGGGRPNRVDELTPLLHVHAKRGELNEAIAVFEDISLKYGLTPNLKCHNILLNAHGKVNDIDGAIVLFDKLLSTPFGPDHYSFGTMMGICVARGDLEGAKDLFQMAKDRGIPKSTAMVDALVLGHIHEGQLSEAEEICENALKMDFEKGTPIRMWNYLLTAYAMRPDLVGANRILRRMQDAGLKFDALTYSALMQGLAMARQPDRAYTILKKVMPQAGIRATSFHYGVVMGGYIANGEVNKVFGVHNRMLERGLSPTTTTERPVLVASAIQDQMEASPEARLQRADRYFQAALSTMDAQEIAQAPRKGVGQQALDVALPSTYFEYIIFVYAQRNANNQVQELYGRYLEALPPHRRNEPSIKILNALMIARLRQKDFSGVDQCWDLIFAQAKQQSIDAARIGTDESKQPKVPVSREYALSLSFSTYISALAQQNKIRELRDVVAQILDSGFKLDNNNWNLYVQTLSRKLQYKEAFELCEKMLMGGWMGWSRLRAESPGRNRLSVEQRMLKRNPAYLRPKYHTFLFLGRALLEIRAVSAEGRASRELMDELEKSCPRTLSAIRTMQREDSQLEREILGGEFV